MQQYVPSGDHAGLRVAATIAGDSSVVSAIAPVTGSKLYAFAKWPPLEARKLATNIVSSGENEP
jgi:hypothetical protein